MNWHSTTKLQQGKSWTLLPYCGWIYNLRYLASYYWRVLSGNWYQYWYLWCITLPVFLEVPECEIQRCFHHTFYDVRKVPAIPYITIIIKRMVRVASFHVVCAIDIGFYFISIILVQMCYITLWNFIHRVLLLYDKPIIY